MPLAITSLTLQLLLKAVASRTALAAPAVAISGLSAAAQALAVASAAGEMPVLAIVPRDADVEQLTADVRFFFGALQGASERVVAGSVLPFPSPEVDPYRAMMPHFDVVSARARALAALSQGTAQIVVASAPALLPRVASPARLRQASGELISGSLFSPTDLTDLLTDAGFTSEDPVDQNGEFCGRGGVVDFFPVGEAYPIRAEFAGDRIESLRRYNPATQRSITSLDRVSVFPLREAFEPPADSKDDPRWAVLRDSTVLDYLADLSRLRVFVAEWDDCEERAARIVAQAGASFEDVRGRGQTVPVPEKLLTTWTALQPILQDATRLESLVLDTAGAVTADEEPRNSRHVACQPAVAFHGRLAAWVAEIRQGRDRGIVQVFVAATPGRAERIVELLSEYELTAVPVDHAENTHGAALLVVTGRLSRGFCLVDAAFQIYTEADLFDEDRRVRDRRPVAQSFFSDLRDLKVGDHVVHVEHGIARFVGLKRLAVGTNRHEFMELRYEGNDKLFVPIEHLDLIQKHTGAGRTALDRLGGTTWEKAKTRVRKALRNMADELLKLYAARRAKAGYAFSSDTHWQEEFDAAFEYELTPDQRTAVADIRRDLEAPSPMDRLLCGDVGYGKTEVALRAAFKAVMDGKQVALLAPTTVLTFQHFKTLSERFAAFPVRIEMISRFRTRPEQKATLADVANGKVDVIVGTHRLLSKDVRFHDLGLLIVDEEQQFGVAHKERIKQLRHKIDVLTLTATPIPRTLNMSLVNIRDMSVIETPPKDRLAIQTNVMKFDPEIIACAIRKELERGGQIYFVHNHIESIDSVADLIRRLVPEIRLAVAHGQLSESALERVMIDFVAHDYDVLLATTIIENGLDIPNVNTIIVNHAERHGLAQLYQLRGRVGRSDRHAYAYLLVPPEHTLSGVARQRLAAIKEFSDLGSGFRVAALDLEIRGAGNLLGAEQSGHIEGIGFDMYVKLLDQTVRELRGEEVEDERRAAVNLGIDLRIGEGYISETNQRLAVYRQVGTARDETELAAALEGVADRYGPMPCEVVRLAQYGRIRLLADRLGVESIDRERHLLVLKFRADAPVDPSRLITLVQRNPDVTLTPPAVIRMDLDVVEGDWPGDRQPRRRLDDDSTSWWTKHATSGQLTDGFSKQALTAAGRVGGDDQLLRRVSGLLAELNGEE